MGQVWLLKAKESMEMYDDRRGGGYNSAPREMHDAVCSECKQKTQVPFKPSGDRPVYCRECFQKRRPSRY